MKVHLFPMQRSPRSLQAKKILLACFLVIVSLVIMTPHIGFAQTDLGLNSAAGIGLGTTDLKTTIVRIIRIILGFLGILTVGLIIYAGFIWMTSGGDESKVERAKKILINAIIGLIIILAAFIIVSFVLNSFQNNINNPNNPPICTDCDPIGPTSRHPIQSTFPANLQKDVPINTMIVVTFRQKIDPATICETLVDGKCSSSKMKNVEICQLDSQTRNCLPDSELFGISTFANTIVTNKDDYNFVFLPMGAGSNIRQYLGLEDHQNRDFQVTLKQGINKLGKNESIFKGFNNKYSWVFTTNGELDLDPPEVQSTNKVINNGYSLVSGVYPGPDDAADGYAASSEATPSKFTFASGSTAPNLNIDPWVSAITPAATNNASLTVSVTGTYGGDKDAHFRVQTFQSGNTKTSIDITDTNSNPIFASSTDYQGSNTIYIGSFGLTFNLTGGRGGVAGGTNQWDFDTRARKEGDRLQVLRDGQVLKTYILGKDILAANVNPTGIAQKIVSDYPTTFKSCGAACVETIATGTASKSYAFKFLDKNTTNISTAFLTNLTQAGQNVSVNITTNGKPDEYRNTIYQINFNEAINPLELDKIVIAYSAASTNGALVSLDKSKIQYSLGNGYRTIELKGNIECGVNACGEKIYCWPVNAQLDPNGDGEIENPTNYANKATHYQLAIETSAVQKCAAANESWCASWGGTCSAGGTCSKTIENQEIVYPASLPSCAGAADAWCTSAGGTCQADSGNRCKTATGFFAPEKLGVCSGNNDGWCTAWGGTCSAGQACTKQVASQTSLYPTADFNNVSGVTDMALNSFNGGFNYYKDTARNKYVGIANGAVDNYILNSTRPYFTPISTHGDGFEWSFYISDMIDLQSPLLRSVSPKGEQMVDDQAQPVNFVFNKVMSMFTLRPGYNYGETLKEQTKRYLVLDPITQGRGIGYRVDSDNRDGNNDGDADYSFSNIVHSNFELNYQYSPLAGSGIESITQNCFIPGGGPLNAGNDYTQGGAIYHNKPSNACNYTDRDGTDTLGCVTDSDLIDVNTRVLKTNPASWAMLTCKQIVGAVLCAKEDTNKECKILYYDKNNSTTDQWGSWVITKDFPTANASGRTGCCFGQCISK